MLRLEQARTPDATELTQARRLLASQGQALPEQYRPALRDLRIACFHTDHLGTPLRLSDDQGRLLWRATPDDWAAVRDQQGDTDQPIRFQGQYHDEESGLYYNRYRYYAPELGRYVSQDPIGLLGGANIYAYPLNPQLFIDQLGLDKTTWGGKGSSVFDGPKNGNWGGKCWSGGQNSCGGESPGTAEPTDSADACYKAHDECFIDCEDKYGNTAEMFCKPLVCNATLKSCLSNLPKNMTEWQKPPAIGTEQDTASFMQQASGWFTTKDRTVQLHTKRMAALNYRCLQNFNNMQGNDMKKQICLIVSLVLLAPVNVFASICSAPELKSRAHDFAVLHSEGKQIDLKKWFVKGTFETAFIKSNEYVSFFEFSHEQTNVYGGLKSIEIKQDKAKKCNTCAIATVIRYKFKGPPFEGTECWSLEDDIWKISAQ
nr:RHS repeat-associated core domain-containing protein [Pseudomonas sp. RIT-PI-AD]